MDHLRLKHNFKNALVGRDALALRSQFPGSFISLKGYEMMLYVQYSESSSERVFC